MSTITFDTLQFTERLEQAGIPREHAKAEAEALRAVLQTTTAELATKADLREMKTEIDGKFTLLQWMIGLSLALSVGIISMLMRLFFALPQQ